MVPKVAIDLAKSFEGFYAKPYICPAGFWTIGYGHLCKHDHPRITQEQGLVYLESDLGKALQATLRHCPVLALESERRLAAIVDFTFNLGTGRLQTSTLRRRINAQDWPGAATQLMRWVHGGGRVLPGLVARRKAEAALLDAERQGHWRRPLTGGP